MNRRCLAVALTCSLMAAAPERAAAQSTPPPAATPKADAKSAEAFFREGIRLYAAKRWQEAEKVFLAAWELNPTFDVAYNLGMAEYQLKKPREATEYLSFALRHWPLINAVGKLHGLAKQRYEESRAQVVGVSVTASAAGAEVLVDGEVVGKSPLEGELFVEPGEHRVEARLAGVEFAGETVRGEKGATVKVELMLKPPPDEGKAEGAMGKAAGNGAPSGTAAPEGKAVAAAPPEEPRSMVPAIALGAASVVALGVGVGMTVASNSAKDDGRRQAAALLGSGGGCIDAPPDYSGACANLQATASRVDTFARVATVTYIASGVLAVAAATYVLWPRSKRSGARNIHASPDIRLGYGGFAMSGTW